MTDIVPGGLSFLHVVAHPDDDLYFMNPEIARSLRTAAPVTGVYLTSGDADGHNHRYGTLPHERGPADFERFARARQNGLKGAYAAMALGDRAARWSSGVLTAPDGAQLETFTLEGASQVRLVFLNIRQQGTATDGQTARLRMLWDDTVPDVPTLLPTGTELRETGRYTRAGLVRTLAWLFDTFRPTTVRTMDPDPDHQVHDAQNRQHHDYGDHSDHQDHTATAQFTWLALQSYTGPGGAGHFAVEAYRGYYNERWVPNLMPEAYSAKEFYLNIYGCADGYDCGDPAGGGDYTVAFSVRGTGWAQATRHRYVGATDWLRTGPDGRLTAFGVLGQRVVRWLESAPGSGRFDGPELLGLDGPVAPRLAIDLTPDGRWQLFATRLTRLSHDPEQQLREIVHSSQSKRGGAFGPWTSLGNPSPTTYRMRQLGTPAVARDGKGRLHLFVRNWGKGVSSRMQNKKGVWGDWLDLHGGAIQDGLTAVTAPGGTIDVFGAGRDRVFHWFQSSKDSDVVLAPRFRLTTPADPPTATVADGRVQVFYRRPETAGFYAAAQSDHKGNWNDGPAYITGRGGFGPLTAVPSPVVPGAVLLVGRNDFAGLGYQFRPLPGGPAAADRVPGDGSWTDLPAPIGGFVHSASAAYDSTGRAVIAVQGSDGRLHVCRQLAPGAGPFGDWVSAAS
ncbi:PIG-L family deacetylase [Kitasatospora sp. NPDC001175]|uniref:PIG-L family deacetylase n=1 Tax=Kitasatospora sp. NPDC001175 TaxID=3157103 RepID=UPI003D06C991